MEMCRQVQTLLLFAEWNPFFLLTDGGHLITALFHVVNEHVCIWLRGMSCLVNIPRQTWNITFSPRRKKLHKNLFQQTRLKACHECEKEIQRWTEYLKCLEYCCGKRMLSWCCLGTRQPSEPTHSLGPHCKLSCQHSVYSKMQGQDGLYTWTVPACHADSTCRIYSSN